jgi:hypothetical protein
MRRLGRDILISACVVAMLLAAILLPFQARGYQLLDRRIETNSEATIISGGRAVACSYLSFSGRETFVRTYYAAEPRDDYFCPRLRKRGDEPLFLAFDE